MTSVGQSTVVKQACIVRAGASKVWEAVSTREGWEGWFANRCLLDFRPGGFIHFRWKDYGPDRYTGDTRCDIDQVEPRKGFAFHWKSHKDHPRTRVQFRLEARGPITVVRVEETGFGSDVQGAIDNSGGWGACLTSLKVWIEHGVDFDGRRPRGNRRRATSWQGPRPTGSDPGSRGTIRP